MAASTALMGPRRRFATSRPLTAFCAVVAAAVCGINAWFLVQFRQAHLPPGAGATVGWAFLMAAYYGLIAYFAAGPDRVAAWAARAAAPRAAAAGRRLAAAAGGVAAWAKGQGGRWDPESLLEVHL